MVSTIERPVRERASKSYEVKHRMSPTEDTGDGFLRILRSKAYYPYTYESPEARDARLSSTRWEALQTKADLSLVEDPIYMGVYSEYLAFVESFQDGGRHCLSDRELEEMIKLGGQMREFERIANKLAPILTGRYPRNLHLPPDLS